MGLKEKYDHAIQTAKGFGFQGTAEERDGKLYMKGTVQTQPEANKIWDAIKVNPTWPDEIVADIQASNRAPAAGSAAGRTHTVQPGDTLSKIAKQHLGDANAYREIFDLN